MSSPPSNLPRYRPDSTPNGWEDLTGYIGCPSRLMGQAYAWQWLSLHYRNGGDLEHNSARTVIAIEEAAYERQCQWA